MADKSLVLVAEDNETLRKMLCMVLARAGYFVYEATDGAQAVALARKNRPDMIVLDIRMPNMDGLTALRTIRQTKWLSNVPVLMLSALSQREDVVSAVRAGASDYMVKSAFNIKDFLARIARFVSECKTEQKEPQDSASEASPPDQPQKQPASEPAAAAPTDDRWPRAAVLQDANNLPELARHSPPITRVNVNDHLVRIAEVKALPFVMPRVLALTASQFSSADQLVEVIEKDAALTGKVLAMANSSIYRRSRDQVLNLSAAVKNIGFNSVRQAALGLGMIELFQPLNNCQPDVDRLKFWQHSLATASIANQLAARAGMDCEQAFVVGLLHSIGQLIQDDFFHKDLSGLLKLCASRRALPADIERRWMGLDHTQLARAAMNHWQLPGELCDPVSDHLLPLTALRNKPEPRRRWAGLLATASQLAGCLGLGDPAVLRLNHVPNDMLDDFGVDVRLVEELRDFLPGQIRELQMIVLMYMPSMRTASCEIPVSGRPLAYYRPRATHFDFVELYLQLRHSSFQAFTDLDAFAAHVRTRPDDLAVVNLLPSPAAERMLGELDRWAEQDATSRSANGLVLIRPDQAPQLTGPFGQAWAGLLAPMSVRQLNAWLGLDAAGGSARKPRENSAAR